MVINSLVDYAPLWDDDRIRDSFKANTSTVQDFRLAQRMRDEYEALVSNLRQENDKLAESIMMMIPVVERDRSLPPQ